MPLLKKKEKELPRQVLRGNISFPLQQHGYTNLYPVESSASAFQERRIPIRFAGSKHDDDSNMVNPSYTVEHLATFGYGPNFGLNSLVDGVRKLKQMELTNAIWAQRMLLRLKKDCVVVEDENMEVVEAFPLPTITEVSAHLSSSSSDTGGGGSGANTGASRDMYNNLLMFVVNENVGRTPNNSVMMTNGRGVANGKPHHNNMNGTKASTVACEIHIFQCVRISADEVADDIRHYIQGRFNNVPGGRREAPFDAGRLPSFPYYDHSPPTAIFPTSAANIAPHPPQHQQQQSQTHHFRSGSSLSDPRQQPLFPAASAFPRQSMYFGTSHTLQHLFERDVALLNRSFDDIERFVARIQQAAVFQREIEAAAISEAKQQQLVIAKKQKGIKRFDSSASSAIMPGGYQPMTALPVRQVPPFFPTELEFVDIFQKFKLCFNLLAKLKNHIHEPNAPELLHILFTPFALILDACTWGIGRHLVSQVFSPSLSLEAKTLLENSLTSREKEVWISLGDAWTSPDANSPNAILRNNPDFIDGSPHSDLGRPPLLSYGSSRPIEQPDSGLNDRLKRLAFEEDRIMKEKEELARKEMILKQKEIILLNREENLQREIESSSRSTPDHHVAPSTNGYRSSPQINMANRQFTKADVYSTNGGTNPSSADQSPPAQNGRSAGDQMNIVNGERSAVNPPVQVSDRQQAYLEYLKRKPVKAKIAQVTYDRVGQNQKELSVTKMEYLEVLNDTKKWWECRSVNNETGFVPHTILKVMSDQELNILTLAQNGSSSNLADEQTRRFGQNGHHHVVNGNGKEISKTNGHVQKTNGEQAATSYPDYLVSKIGARGEFRYF